MGISIRKVELCRKKREELCATKEEDLQQCSARRRAETQALASHGFAEAASSHRVGRHGGAGGLHPRARGCRLPLEEEGPAVAIRDGELEVVAPPARFPVRGGERRGREG
jgi:hypothetical protein